MEIKYIVYTRKSTKDKERQVLSLDSQVNELKSFASRNGLTIIQTIRESRTAKIPGRPLFNKMLAEIGKGHSFPVGILAWGPDRLSRNKTDEARITTLLESGKIADLKFPTHTFVNNASGKYFLSMQFLNAKYYIDLLSENVKRGQAEKLRQGAWPAGNKTFGYVRDNRIRNIRPDRKYSKFVHALFNECLRGQHSITSLHAWARTFYRNNRWRGELGRASIHRILRNPIYCGLMKWNGKTYEGRFKAVVSTEVFQKVQIHLQRARTNPDYKTGHYFAFKGLFHCPCGALITAQTTHGNGGVYRYYRCTRHKGPCNEPYIEERPLTQQLLAALESISFSQEALTSLETLAKHRAREFLSESRNYRDRLVSDGDRLLEKQTRLTELYLDNKIEEDIYEKKKDEFMIQKRVLSEDIHRVDSLTGSDRFEPVFSVIKALKQATFLRSKPDLQKISELLKIIGSNHTISRKNATLNLTAPYDYVAKNLASFDLAHWSHPEPGRPNFSDHPALRGHGEEDRTFPKNPEHVVASLYHFFRSLYLEAPHKLEEWNDLLRKHSMKDIEKN